MAEAKAMEKSISELVQTINTEPNNWAAYVDLIGALVLANALPEAEELGLKSLALFEADTEATQQLLYAVGNVYYSAGAYDRAQTYFDRITDEELSSDAHLMQAQSLYGQGQYQKALAYALTYNELLPKDVDGIVLLGRIWLALNKLDQAKDLFDQALALDEKHYGALFARGVAEMAKEQKIENEWLLRAKEVNKKQYEADAAQLDAWLTTLGGA